MPELAPSSSEFGPLGQCLGWQPTLLRLYVVSDVLIILAYLSLPLTLFYFARRRGESPIDKTYLCFGALISTCVMTHLSRIWTLWKADYWLDVSINVLTAAASIATVVFLARLVPKGLVVAGPQLLANAHAELQRANDVLEERVRERTAELTGKNKELAAEVADHAHAKEALRVSEARYRRLADAGIIGILTADLKGGIVDCNDAFVRMLGYTPEDRASGGLRWTELTPTEWLEHDRTAVEQLQRVGVVPAWEKEYFHKNGTRVPVLVGAAMLDAAAGTCVCFVLDLSERRRAESALEHMRAEHAIDVRFRALLDAAPDAMVVSSAGGRIEIVNEQTEKLFGYSRHELFGKNLELLVPERLRGAHAEYVERFFARPSARAMGGSGFELFGRRKDGTEIPIEVSLSPLRSQGELTVSAAIRDISDRKRMEAEHKLMADRLTSAVESIQNAFALFDDRDNLVLCNVAYRQLLGRPAHESLLGAPYAQLLSSWVSNIAFADDAQRERFFEERLTLRHDAPTTTFQVRLRDGRTLRVTDRRTPEGGTVKVIWDLTEDVQRAEELREARNAAEAASNAKSEFLSSMSHELRTPMNAILGFAQLLQRDRKEPLSERHRERVDQILKGGEHLLHLINDVLDLSKIESGNVAVSIEPVSVYDVLDEVKATLEPMAARAGIHFEAPILPADLPLVAADRTRFVQILLNFGSNAIKYNRPAGSVRFAVSVQSPQLVRVDVRDSGAGIPAAQQYKLFQPFQRAGQEAGPIEGTGIGLFISKRLAELMAGEVGFSSAAGEGSNFWVDVPVQHTRAAAAPSNRLSNGEWPATPCDRRRVVLYVEDNAPNLAFMRELIDSLDGFELVSAATGEKGLLLARERPPDVILLDINLPGLGGLDVARALREDPATSGIPIFALTAAASERDKQRGIEAGFQRYLTKPVDVEQLVAALESLP